jgi:hypothetical protein
MTATLTPIHLMQPDLRTLLTEDPGEGPLVINCINPDHDDSTASMAVYHDHAWCFGCSSYYGARVFSTLLPTGAGLPEFRHVGVGRVEKEQSYLPMALAETYAHWLWNSTFIDRVDWLRARGLHDDTLKANLIGHSGEAFTIPVLDREGQLISIRYRRDDGLAHSTERPKYWGTGGRNTAQLYKPIRGDRLWVGNSTILCEGELDALRLAQEGYHAVSMTNGAGAFKEEHAALLPSGQVYICYDQDEAGLKGCERVRMFLGSRAIPIRWAPALGKDVTEYLQRWPLRKFDELVLA